MIDERKLNTARNLSRYTSVADEFLDMHIKPSSEWKSWRSLVVKFSISLPYLMYLTYVMFGLKKEKTSLFCSGQKLSNIQVVQFSQGKIGVLNPNATKMKI